MIPQKNQYIKIILIDNLQVEGLVEEWSENKIILKSADSKTISVINNSRQNVILYSIITDFMTPQERQKKLSEMEVQFQQEQAKPSADNFRIMRLADLKKAMAEQQKQIVANQLKEHMPRPVNYTKYTNPFIPAKK